MHKINFYSVVSLVFIFTGMGRVVAQCDQCKVDTELSVDDCFVEKQFPGLCMKFNAANGMAYLDGGKKMRSFRVGHPDSTAYMIALATDKSLKLSAMELLFVERGLGFWHIRKHEIGMTFTDSGLGYKIIEAGGDRLPVVGETLLVHFVGRLANGTVFDSTYGGDPISFALGDDGLIEGWSEGMSLLTVGTKAVLQIPSGLAYGQKGKGSIPPNATLYYEVELVAIE